MPMSRVEYASLSQEDQDKVSVDKVAAAVMAERMSNPVCARARGVE